MFRVQPLAQLLKKAIATNAPPSIRMAACSYSSQADVSTFKFPTKEELIQSHPTSKFGRPIQNRKVYLAQGYFERLESPLILVYQHNNMSVPEYRALQQQLIGLGCKVQTCRAGIMRAILKETPFEAMSPLFVGPTMMIYSHDLKDASITSMAHKVHAALGKNRKLTFLGAKADKLLFSNATFKHFANLPSLPELYSQLLGSLQANPTRIISLLSQNSQMLSQLLSMHKDNLKGK